MLQTYKIVLLRHGESEWNKINKFCGWFDADLSESGSDEARDAGKVYYVPVVLCFKLPSSDVHTFLPYTSIMGSHNS